MSNITEFVFGSNQVRVVTIEGEPWFVSRDLCDVLDIKNIRQNLDSLDDDEKLTYTIHTSGQNRLVTLVSESGMYVLVLKSRKPEAKPFRKWVTSEVLPSIRKTGKYQVETEEETKVNTDYVPANLESLQGIITGLLNNPASLTTDQLLRVIDQSIKVMHIMMQYHKIGMYQTADCISQVSQIVKPPKEENQRLKVQTLSEVRKCGSVQTFEENFDARSVAETWMNTFKESEFPTNRKKINEPEVKVIDTIRSRSDEWLDTFVKPEFYDDKTFSKYVETHLTYTGSLIDSVWFEDFFKGAKKFGLLSSKLTPGQQAALLKGWMERYLKSSRKKLKVSDVFCNGYIRGFHRKF